VRVRPNSAPDRPDMSHVVSTRSANASAPLPHVTDNAPGRGGDLPAASTTESEPAGVNEATPGRRRRGAAWDDAPLRIKLPLLITLAVVVGSLIGMVEAHLGHTVWPLGLGLTGSVILLVWIGHVWVCRPFEILLRQLGRIRTISSPNTLETLAQLRRDEIGQLAHAVHVIATAAMRDQREVRRLRRTLDHRIASATRHATQQLRQMAMRDPLTNLGNRHFLDSNLEPLVASAVASGTDLICIMLDLDNFKCVNDSHGHATGDEFLIFVANLVHASVRRNDYAVRLGGDEFVVLMPDCSLDRALKVADQIQDLFRQHARIAFAGDFEVGVSMGIAGLARDGVKTGQELLQRADANLYAAKRAGKGQTVGHDRPCE